MSVYRTCPHCGAHLDPGERCDCAFTRSAGAFAAQRVKRAGREMKQKTKGAVKNA